MVGYMLSLCREESADNSVVASILGQIQGGGPVMRCASTAAPAARRASRAAVRPSFATQSSAVQPIESAPFTFVRPRRAPEAVRSRRVARVACAAPPVRGSRGRTLRAAPAYQPGARARDGPPPAQVCARRVELDDPPAANRLTCARFGPLRAGTGCRSRAVRCIQIIWLH
jgi:hypothetical protein